jgi:hypothetical protein
VLWSSGQRYAELGKPMLLFQYPPSKLGLSRSGRGSAGTVPTRLGGRNPALPTAICSLCRQIRSSQDDRASLSTIFPERCASRLQSRRRNDRKPNNRKPNDGKDFGVMPRSLPGFQCAQQSSQFSDVEYRLLPVLGSVFGLGWSQLNVITGHPT